MKMELEERMAEEGMAEERRNGAGTREIYLSDAGASTILEAVADSY